MVRPRREVRAHGRPHEGAAAAGARRKCIFWRMPPRRADGPGARGREERRLMPRPASGIPGNAKAGSLLGMTIRDFGPISSASIAVKPLTVFIGPNNSGKSYAARLLHSIMAAQRDFCESAARRPDTVLPCRRIIAKKYRRGRKTTVVDGAGLKEAADALLEKGLCGELRRSLVRNFGSPAGNLVRAGRKRSLVTVSPEERGGGGRLELSISSMGGIAASGGPKSAGYVIEEGIEPGSYALRPAAGAGAPAGDGGGIAGDNGPQPARSVAAGRGRKSGGSVDALSAELAGMMARRMLHNAARRRWFYLPAGRSSTLQAYRAMSAGIMAHSASPESGRPDGLGVPGTVADFLAEITRLSGARGPFFGLARRMEGEILSGAVHLSTATPGGHPSILYRLNGRRVPLSQAASSVSEIAPLSLYLKHLVEPGNVMIIEEPEAHLHPAGAVILAKYIVRLVRGGLHVLLTTHSPYLLEKLGKYVMAGRLPPRDRVDGLGYERDDYLVPDEVSAYLFRGSRGGGYRAVEVDRDSDDYGISQEEFVNVDVKLNEETVYIHSRKNGHDSS